MSSCQFEAEHPQEVNSKFVVTGQPEKTKSQAHRTDSENWNQFSTWRKTTAWIIKWDLSAPQSVDRFSTLQLQNLQVILVPVPSAAGRSAQPKKKCATEPDSTYFGKYFKLMAKKGLLSIVISWLLFNSSLILKKLVGFLKNSSSLILNSREFFGSQEPENFLFQTFSILKNLCHLSSLQHVTKRNSHCGTAKQAYWQWGWWLWCWVV